MSQVITDQITGQSNSSSLQLPQRIVVGAVWIITGAVLPVSNALTTGAPDGSKYFYSAGGSSASYTLISGTWTLDAGGGGGNTPDTTSNYTKATGYFGDYDYLGYAKEITTLAVGTRLPGGVWCPLNNRVYVCNYGTQFGVGGGSIAVVDPVARALITTITVSGTPKIYAAAYSHTNGKVLLTDNGNMTVVVVDPTTNTITSTLSMPGGTTAVMGIAYCPTNDRFYVQAYVTGALTYQVITSVATPAIESSFGSGVGGTAVSITWIPSSNRLYSVTTAVTSPELIDPANGNLNNSLGASVATLLGSVYCPIVDRVYLVGNGADHTARVKIADPLANGGNATILGSGPTIALAPGAWVYNPRTGKIVLGEVNALQVLDPVTNAVWKSETVSGSPLSMVFSPVTGEVLGLCDNGNVSFIS